MILSNNLSFYIKWFNNNLFLKDHCITWIIHQIPANIGKGADIVLGVTEPSHSAQNLESSTTIFLSKRKDSKVEDISTAA